MGSKRSLTGILLVIIAVFLATKLVIKSIDVAVERNPYDNPESPNARNKIPKDYTEKDKIFTDKRLLYDTSNLHKIDARLAQQPNSSCLPQRPSESDVVYMNSYWHVFRDSLDEVLIISAFYDERDMGGFLPKVRILTVAKDTKSAKYCLIWYDTYARPYVADVIVNVTGRGERINGTKYGQYEYSCQLPVALPIPTHVSITTSPCTHPVTTFLPIYNPVRSLWEKQFGICVAIAFGSLDMANFVEWMEFNQMLGVAEINIYNATIEKRMGDIFKYYIDKGVLNVHHMPPPVLEYGVKAAKLGSPASLNDCMMRYMYRYQYIIVIDFDEFIVPRMHSNYSDMLNYINEEEKLTEYWYSYTFHNTFYFDHFPQNKSEPEYLKTMRFRFRSKPSGFLYASKSFIDPRRCFSVFNHYCWTRFPNTKKFTVDVKTSTARSHHYRKCGLGKKNCEELTAQQEEDDVTLKFKDILESRVRNVLNMFNMCKVLSC